MVTRGAVQTVSPVPAGLTLTGYAPGISQGLDIVPQVYAFTIMLATTTNRRADLGAALNLRTALPAHDTDLATIMTTAPVNRTAALGPASINRAVSFP